MPSMYTKSQQKARVMNEIYTPHQPKPETMFVNLVRFLSSQKSNLNKVEYALLALVVQNFQTFDEMPPPTIDALMVLSHKYGYWHQSIDVTGGFNHAVQ